MAHPFLAASRWASVRGTELGGVTAVAVAGIDVLQALKTGAGTCANVLLGPRSLRRELFGAGGTVLETVLVSDRHPGVVAQWRASAGSGLALDVMWTVPGAAAAHRSARSILRVRPESGPDRLFALHPPPDTWEMESGARGLTVRVRVRAEEGAVTLLAGAVPAHDEGSDLLRSLAATEPLLVRAEAFAETVRTRCLAVTTGVPELDDGLAWAVARTAAAADPRGRLLGDPESTGLTVLWTVVGALAAGERAVARDIVRESPTDIERVLALGWWVLWTGDARPLERHRSRALEILSPAPDDVIHRVARRVTLQALEALGDRSAATHLRGQPAVRLPTLTGSAKSDGGREAILSAVFGDVGPGIHRARSGPRGPERALCAWAHFACGHATEGYELLREHLTDGMRAGTGLWPSGDDSGSHYDPIAAALAPAVVLNGLFGARSEAPWGRLRLAPQLPPTWTRASLTGVYVGDARISLHYTSNETTRTFVLEQSEGRVPVDLVFEPSVDGVVSSVLVDDGPTDIVPETKGGRSRVRLQMPLDGERKVVLFRTP